MRLMSDYTINDVTNWSADMRERMEAKGLTNCTVDFWIQPLSQNIIVLNYRSAGVAKNEYIHADGMEGMDKVEQWLVDLPSQEERKLKEFMEALAVAVTLGKNNGIDLDFVNPLEKMMKKLSANALKYYPKPKVQPAPDPDEWIHF